MGLPESFDLALFSAIIAASTLTFATVSPIAMFWHGWVPRFVAKPHEYWPRWLRRRVVNSHWHWVRDYDVDLYKAQGFRKVRCHLIREVRLRQKHGYAVLMRRIDVKDEKTCQHSSSSLEHICTSITGEEYQELVRGLPDGETKEEFLRYAIALSLENQQNRK